MVNTSWTMSKMKMFDESKRAQTTPFTTVLRSKNTVFGNRSFKTEKVLYPESTFPDIIILSEIALTIR